jgi:methylenetetrahydrofolate dehydrogenase (NADP+)/methenyltetrahydrofolate cyclohydrolase/formyltetrahydrofolate synthetase/formate--tetrahydrofolate ligase
MANLRSHIATALSFGVPVVVAINRFPTDSQHEHDLIKEISLAAGAMAAVTTDHHAQGGEGARDLAEVVVEACDQPGNFNYLYPLDQPIKTKIETIAKQVYGAAGVDYSPKAEQQIADFEKAGFGYLPICMAKTHLSISHDPTLKGAPKNFTVPVREVRASVGAGFIYPLLGEMRTMPGLGTKPAYMSVDIDEEGNVVGLS